MQYQSVTDAVVPQQVEHTYEQMSLVSRTHDVVRRSWDGGNGYHTFYPGQQMMPPNLGGFDQRQDPSPTVEVDLGELLEFQKRRSSASTEETEVLTPAQRRRKAQNRAAYVSIVGFVSTSPADDFCS